VVAAIRGGVPVPHTAALATTTSPAPSAPATTTPPAPPAATNAAPASGTNRQRTRAAGGARAPAATNAVAASGTNRQRTRSVRGARAPAPAAKRACAQGDPVAGPLATDLICPRCKQATLVAGHRGWGCARWRQGCAFVIWFEIAGRRITEAELTDLVSKGHTRKRKWRSREGAAIAGRLVLDLAASRETGAARLDGDGPVPSAPRP